LRNLTTFLNTVAPVSFLFLALVANFVFLYVSEPILAVYDSLINHFGSPSDAYPEGAFAQMGFRFTLSAVSLAIFYAVQILYLRAPNLGSFFRIHYGIAISFMTFFVYMYYGQFYERGITINGIHFASWICTVFFEQLVFFSGIALCKDRKSFILFSLAAWAVFILLHPIELSFGRFGATFVMLNMWIYTSIVRNIWMGVLFHGLWNFLAFGTISHSSIAALSFLIMIFTAVRILKLSVNDDGRLVQGRTIWPDYGNER
jgi:hypothetical protein